MSVTPLGWNARGGPGQRLTGADLDALFETLRSSMPTKPEAIDFVSPLPARPPAHSIEEPILVAPQESMTSFRELTTFGFSEAEASEFGQANSLHRVREVIGWVKGKKDVKNPLALARSLLRK